MSRFVVREEEIRRYDGEGQLIEIVKNWRDESGKLTRSVVQTVYTQAEKERMLADLFWLKPWGAHPDDDYAMGVLDEKDRPWP